jgi:phosphatidylglycerophosphate synthase
MAESTSETARRTTRAVLAEPERRLLRWLAPRLPSWVLPDHLTGFALFGAAVVAASYGLSNLGPGWLWVANAGLALHWFGDSLDGTLARHRKIERPKYGFYVDHLADALATVAVALGLGLSPYLLLAVGFAIGIGYLLLSINIYLETIVQGEFRFGYGWIGPTEARLLLMILNGVAAAVGPLEFAIPTPRGPVVMTYFDVAGIAAAAGMGAMLVRRIVRNLAILSRQEPADRPRGRGR